MASTYSTLKIELIGTGEQAGLWGTTTNTNLGTAIEEAIVGSADVSFSSADVTLTLTNTNAAQTARNLRLNLTGTSGGARNLILGSGCQIEKPYLINNGLADTVTVKNTTGTGIAVPAGKTMWVYNNGTNVVDAVTHLTSLTLGSALPITSGGTGSTSTQFVNLTTNVTGDLPFANLAQGSALSVLGVTGNAIADVASIAAGTDNQVLRRSGTTVAFGAVNLASSDAVTGALAVTNGGTGGTSQSTARTGLGATTLGGNLFTITNPSAITFPRFNADNTVSSLSAADFRTAIGAGTGGGTVTSVGGTGTVNGITLTGTVTSTGNLTLGGTLSGVSLTTQVTGTLPIANGGTGQTTQQAALNALAGATTSAQFLRGNGTNVLMSAIQAADVPTLNQNTTGSAATLTTARTIQTNLASTSSASFNGSANVTPGVTGTLPVGNGGTGATTFTAGNYLKGNGTSAIAVQSGIPAGDITSGTLAVARGGTGITSFGTGVATWLGTPSSANLASAVTDETGSGALVFATTPVITGLREKSVAIAASDIDLSLGNYFTRTISGATTLTVSNVATSGDVAAFVLVLTNGGSAVVTFFSGVTWAGGTAPTLTSSGVDVLAFFTINGGTTWRGLVLATDIKAP